MFINYPLNNYKLIHRTLRSESFFQYTNIQWLIIEFKFLHIYISYY